MNKRLALSLTFALGLTFGPAAFAAPMNMGKPAIAATAMALNIEADCYAIGQDKAAELGGTLAKAKPDMDGDAPVCRLVIVVPGQNGERPKRVEVTVPQ
jgi:hypothetical protein